MNVAKSDDIFLVKADELVSGPGTPGQPRETAISIDNIWAGVTTVEAKDMPSQWHHHADYDSVMFMIHGEIRVDWGADGGNSFTMGPGDFAYFKRGAIHRAQVISEDNTSRFVAFRVGQGNTVVNVDGPGPTIVS